MNIFDANISGSLILPRHPSNPASELNTGSIFYNSTNNKVFFYAGSWSEMGPFSGETNLTLVSISGISSTSVVSTIDITNHNGLIIDYLLSGSDVGRMGRITTTWITGYLGYQESMGVDIGDTYSQVGFYPSLAGSNVELNVYVVSGTWKLNYFITTL